MQKTKTTRRALPKKFETLVGVMVPQAILDDVQHENTVEMVDRLMAAGPLSAGQELYLETLVELVEAYEAKHENIDIADLGGMEMLRHLLAENGMNATALAGLLGVHVSMGSKLLKGDRALTVSHIRILAGRFHVSPELFLS